MFTNNLSADISKILEQDLKFTRKKVTLDLNQPKPQWLVDCIAEEERRSLARPHPIIEQWQRCWPQQQGSFNDNFFDAKKIFDQSERWKEYEKYPLIMEAATILLQEKRREIIQQQGSTEDRKAAVRLVLLDAYLLRDLVGLVEGYIKVDKDDRMSLSDAEEFLYKKFKELLLTETEIQKKAQAEFEKREKEKNTNGQNFQAITFWYPPKASPETIATVHKGNQHTQRPAAS